MLRLFAQKRQQNKLTPAPSIQNNTPLDNNTTNRQAQDPRILGPGNANLPRLAAAMVLALGEGGLEYCGERGAPRLVALLAAAAQGPAGAEIARAAEGLPAKKREMFRLLMANEGRLPAA